MERFCNFCSQISGFKLAYGGSSIDSFTTYQIGKSNPPFYLNLELDVIVTTTNSSYNEPNSRHFGRIIFHTKDVDELYSHLRRNANISNSILFENEPTDAPWGERYFHILEPDGYLLSFAKTIEKRKSVK
jgi:hypothetical protein